MQNGQPTACPRQRLSPKLCSPLSFQYIPMPVLYGVFLYMGVASLNGIQVRPPHGVSAPSLGPCHQDPKCSLSQFNEIIMVTIRLPFTMCQVNNYIGHFIGVI